MSDEDEVDHDMTGTITKRARKTPEGDGTPDLDTSLTAAAESVPVSKEADDVRQVTKGVKEVELEDKPAVQKGEASIVNNDAEEKTPESTSQAETEERQEEETVPENGDAPSSDPAAELIKAANIPLPDDESPEVSEKDLTYPAEQTEDSISSEVLAVDAEKALKSSDAPGQVADNAAKTTSTESEEVL